LPNLIIHMPWYPKAVFGVLAALIIATALIRPLRNRALAIDVRYLIAFHFTRFIGFYFLYLYNRGELPRNFAVFGGWGDIAVSFLAIAVIFVPRSRSFLALWNLLGLADILAVVVTAARDEAAVPGSMHQLDHLPLLLLPTLIVPLIIFTHGLMLFRLLRRRAV
jgi:hypothetical protein